MLTWITFYLLYYLTTFFLSFNKSSQSLNFLVPDERGTSGYTDKKTLVYPQGSYSLVVEAEMWKLATTWITKWWNYDKGQNKLLCGHRATLLCLSYDCMFLKFQSLNKVWVNWKCTEQIHLGWVPISLYILFFHFLPTCCH